MDLIGTGTMNISARLKWAKNEGQLSTIIQRLQTHKASLSLILTILNGETIQEAKLSVDQLCTSVDKSYQDISNRLKKIEEIQCQWQPAGPTDIMQENVDIVSTASFRSSSEDILVSNGASRTAFGHAFDQDLQNSIVYRRTAFQGSTSS
ncbi:hypothetical protein MMC14_000671 [Varicellaria rhodocarpa]|nr:hypothetical protein [Varicellaria rhodocarpa]